eukprot:726229-Hanusia_phi.AAC.1
MAEYGDRNPRDFVVMCFTTAWHQQGGGRGGGGRRREEEERMIWSRRERTRGGGGSSDLARSKEALQRKGQGSGVEGVLRKRRKRVRQGGRKCAGWTIR